MRRDVLSLAALFLAGIWIVGMMFVQPAFCQEKFVVAHGPGSNQRNQVEWMKRYVTKNYPNLRFEDVEIPYEIYVQKVTTNLMRPESEYDIFWQNDDWCKLFGPRLEPMTVEEVPAINKVDRKEWLDGQFDWEGKVTSVPWTFFSGWLVYRKDLMPKPPTSWKEFQDISMALQKSRKVRWGFAAGMIYPHDAFSLLWTMEANGASLYEPWLEKDNAVLKAHGWKSMVASPQNLENMYFWWDNIHKYKTISPGIVGYTRYAGNAIFMKGDVAMTFNDTSVILDEFENAKVSQVAGKIDVAPGPPGPHGTKPVYTGGPWAWAIPRGAKHKEVAKKVIDYVVGDYQVQMDLWQKARSFPTNLEVGKTLMATDPIFRKYAGPVFRGDLIRLNGIHFHPKNEQMYSINNQYSIRALTGSRDEIIVHMLALKKELEDLMADER